MKKYDEYARRAAEEFLASGRAENPERRAEHRAEALKYVALRDQRGEKLRRGGGK